MIFGPWECLQNKSLIFCVLETTRKWPPPHQPFVFKTSKVSDFCFQNDKEIAFFPVLKKIQFLPPTSHLLSREDKKWAIFILQAFLKMARGIKEYQQFFRFLREIENIKKKSFLHFQTWPILIQRGVELSEFEGKWLKEGQHFAPPLSPKRTAVFFEGKVYMSLN